MSPRSRVIVPVPGMQFLSPLHCAHVCCHVFQSLTDSSHPLMVSQKCFIEGRPFWEALVSDQFHIQFSSVESLSRVQLFASPWIEACQASLSITNSRSSLRLSDAIQPSHPLSSPYPPAPNPSQHQSLFQWAQDGLKKKSPRTKTNKQKNLSKPVREANFLNLLTSSTHSFKNLQLTPYSMMKGWAVFP